MRRAEKRVRDMIDEWRAEEDEERMNDRSGYRGEDQGKDRSLELTKTRNQC